jgi:hypothetical protein
MNVLLNMDYDYYKSVAFLWISYDLLLGLSHVFARTFFFVLVSQMFLLIHEAYFTVLQM